MDIKLSFLGAARNVTGSRYLLEAHGHKVLVDCGLYQEHDLKERNWSPSPVPPEEIDAVVLTHAHLDHCGLLPRLVKEGFRNSIYATPPTADMARVVLEDCAKINEEDAEYKRRRHEKEGRKGPHPEIPLYTVEEAKAVFPYFKSVDFDVPFEAAPGIEVTFRQVGHILGAAMVQIRVVQNGESRTIVFSGDVGRNDMPILNDPDPVGDADYIVCESTYGNRLHGNQADIPTELARVVNATAEARGNLIIPSFAIERTQDLIYYLAQLLRANRIPHLQIFIDSPMAVTISGIFKRYPRLFDMSTTMLLRNYRMPGLTLVRTIAQSKTINHIRGTAIIIAGSGMCTGGRIKHHLLKNLPNPDATILFVGYQARETLGRELINGAKSVRILGEECPVRARIERISGFSAHADQAELTTWLKTVTRPPRHVFVTHGEPDAAEAFASHLATTLGWQTTVPEYLQEICLD